MTKQNPYKIVVTGGPGGGKTTTAELFCKESPSKTILVPEAATMVLLNGFPRTHDPECTKSTQRAIFHLQRNLEEAFQRTYADHYIICDRGTVDGSAYWPESAREEYFSDLGTQIEREFSRYDAVVYLESAAVGGLSIKSTNSTRTETLADAIEIDKRLREAWAQHHNFHFVPHNASFIAKINQGLEVLSRLCKVV